MRVAVALLLACAPAAATAQRPVPAQAGPAGQSANAADPALRTRVEALVDVLAGRGDYDAYFADSFRQIVPHERFAPIAAGLVASLGQPQRIERIDPVGGWSARIVIGYDKGEAMAEIAVDPAAPHRVTGLRITGSQLRDDSLAKVETELRALPGEVRVGVYELGTGDPRPLLALDDESPAPLASSFKLWVLAELSQQVRGGERRWADVAPLAAPSLPSGVMQNWPAGAPATLHTLATEMISISDNTATDTLIREVGRAKLDASARAAGLSTPVLTTREAFAIKADAALTRAWAATDPAGRRALLARQAARIAGATLDATIFSHGGVATDQVEWFASPRSTARLLDSLRQSGDATTLAILSINHGADPTTTARFAYLGFKGGSEPGVLTLNFLARTNAGRWLAATGAWRRAEGDTNEMTFLGLMTRALTLANR